MPIWVLKDPIGETAQGHQSSQQQRGERGKGVLHLAANWEE